MQGKIKELLIKFHKLLKKKMKRGHKKYRWFDGGILDGGWCHCVVSDDCALADCLPDRAQKREENFSRYR